MATDYSLYNLVLSTVDFKNCASYADAVRVMYENLDPYIKKLVSDNKKLRSIIEGTEAREDPEYIMIKQMKADVYLGARELLEKGRAKYLSAREYDISDDKGEFKVRE
jgi:hypothetical protein